MRRTERCFFIIMMLTALMVGCLPARADDVSPDRKYPLLAAYIYNFTQFTSWPASSFKDTFTVCVVGQDPFGASLEAIKSRAVQGKKITVHHHTAEGDLSSCNVLFISRSESGSLKSILSRLKDAPVLTMSEIDGFSDEGGMVEFRPTDGKIGIWIGLAAVKATGLSMSSKLLALANVKG
jgi:hypothetical protein